MTLTSDLENLFNSSQWHDEYFWRVSSKISVTKSQQPGTVTSDLENLSSSSDENL